MSPMLPSREGAVVLCMVAATCYSSTSLDVFHKSLLLTIAVLSVYAQPQPQGYSRPSADSGLPVTVAVPFALLGKISLSLTADIDPSNSSSYYCATSFFALCQCLGLSGQLLFVTVTLAAIVLGVQYDVASTICLFACFLIFEGVTRSFHHSFTQGEATLVSQATATACTSTVLLLHNSLGGSDSPHDEATAFVVLLQYVTLGMGLIGVIAGGLIVKFSVTGQIKRTILLLMALVAVVVCCALAFHRVFQQDPFSWVWNSFAYSQYRVNAVLFWLLTLAAGVPVITAVKYNVNVFPNILVRKLYHAMAVILFTAPLAYTPDFLSLAYGVALALLMLLEFVRLVDVPVVGHLIEGFMTEFTDERDSGTLLVTHLYLLVGCASPLWFCPTELWVPDKIPLAAYAGIAALGVGDTMASVVGVYWGQHRWSGLRKTIEGTAGAIACTTVFLLSIHQLLGRGPDPDASINFLNQSQIVVGAVLMSLMEAFTTQIDNLTLPLFLFGFLGVCATPAPDQG